MRKTIRIYAWAFAAFVIVCLALTLICNQLVLNNAKGKVFSDIDSIEDNEVGLLLGTTPQARLTKVTNYFFIYRIDAAEQLYKAGKIEKILISGDEHSLDGVNEPECMKDSLMARGVPASDIVLDGKGYRTICSVVNANKVFGLKSFTIISQKFHNERALYLAEHLGLDVENIQAFNAKNPNSKRALITYAREYLARVKMFWDILTDKQQINPAKADKEAMTIDSLSVDSIQNEGGSGRYGGLNAIRFNNFKEEDWLDNEYIRSVRKYLDDYNSGRIKDAGLDSYKDKVRGKFVVGLVEPYVMGGLFIHIIFLDSPNDMFSTWVYSSVDKETETILDYEVHGIRMDEEKTGFTKEDILRLIKEHPEYKLW